MLAKFARRSNAWLLRAHGENIMNRKLTFTEALTRVVLIAAAVFVPAAALFSGASAAPNPAPHSGYTEHHCVPVGGSIITNFGGFGPNTTLGTATGDLRGAVGVNIVGASVGTSVGSLGSFTVQHHW